MQRKDDGPDMETHHEDAHRCSRLGHADCGAHLRPARERGAGIAGKLLVRRERLLRAQIADSVCSLPRPAPGLPGARPLAPVGQARLAVGEGWGGPCCGAAWVLQTWPPPPAPPPPAA